MNLQPPDPPEEDEGERWERHLLAVETENAQMKKRLFTVDIVHGPKAEMRWEALMAENAKLRQIIIECATACGAAVSVECSIEFMQLLPGEITLMKTLCDNRGKRLAVMEQRP